MKRHTQLIDLLQNVIYYNLNQININQYFIHD